jgi:hypothetical protein
MALTPVVAEEGDLLITRRIEEGIVIEEVTLVGAAPLAPSTRSRGAGTGQRTEARRLGLISSMLKAK